MYWITTSKTNLQQPFLGLLASFDLIAVREIERLLSFVQVDEVSHIQVTHNVNNVPGIVLRDRYLVHIHVLRSRNQKHVLLSRDWYLP